MSDLANELQLNRVDTFAPDNDEVKDEPEIWTTQAAQTRKKEFTEIPWLFKDTD